MKIKVERDNLLKGLETAGRFISKKTNVEMLKNIFLKASDKTLQFAGTDLSVFCKTTIDVNVEQEGEVLIPFKVVYEVIRKIPAGEEITIEKREKEEKIKISARHFNFTFTTTTVTIDDYSTFIGPEISETPTAKIAAKDLIENINKVKHAAATEEIAKPTSASVLLERKDDKINIVALDGYKTACAVSQNKGEDFAVAVNVFALTKICKVLDPEKITEIYVSSKIVAFKQEGILCKAPLLGQFIAYKPLFENQFEKQEDISTIEVIKDDIIAAIERASVVALEKENNLIKLEIKGNEMVVSSDSENAIITDKVAIDHKGQDYFIAFNSKYLAEGIKYHSEKITITSLGTDTAPWVISSEEGLKTFILPVKIAAKETELKKVS